MSTMAETPTLLLNNNGEPIEIDGDIIRMIGATTVIKLTAGGSLTVPKGQIVRVAISVDGQPLEGDFLDWSEGTWSIRVDGQIMSVLDGRLVTTLPAPPSEPPITVPNNEPAEELEAVQQEPEKKDRWQVKPTM